MGIVFVCFFSFDFLELTTERHMRPFYYSLEDLNRFRNEGEISLHFSRSKVADVLRVLEDPKWQERDDKINRVVIGECIGDTDELIYQRRVSTKAIVTFDLHYEVTQTIERNEKFARVEMHCVDKDSRFPIYSIYKIKASRFGCLVSNTEYHGAGIIGSLGAAKIRKVRKVMLEQLLKKVEKDVLIRRLAGTQKHESSPKVTPRSNRTDSGLETAEISLSPKRISAEFNDLMKAPSLLQRQETNEVGDEEVNSMVEEMNMEMILKIGVSDLSLDELDGMVADIVAGKREAPVYEEDEEEGEGEEGEEEEY